MFRPRYCVLYCLLCNGDLSNFVIVNFLTRLFLFRENWALVIVYFRKFERCTW